jgi:hypothetical protein
MLPLTTPSQSDNGGGQRSFLQCSERAVLCVRSRLTFKQQWWICYSPPSVTMRESECSLQNVSAESGPKGSPGTGRNGQSKRGTGREVVVLVRERCARAERRGAVDVDGQQGREE